MTHQYILLGDEILTIDTREERADVQQRLREEGVRYAPILKGEAGEDGEYTGEQLDAGADITPETIAQAIMMCLNPDADEDARAEAIEPLVEGGRLDMRTFEEACMCTRDAGLVLRIGGGAEYQITIVRSR